MAYHVYIIHFLATLHSRRWTGRWCCVQVKSHTTKVFFFKDAGDFEDPVVFVTRGFPAVVVTKTGYFITGSRTIWTCDGANQNKYSKPNT